MSGDRQRRWRKRHPGLRAMEKTRYYKKHEYSIHRRRKYSIEDYVLILEHAIPDVILAKQLGRNLSAIQITRSVLIKKLKEGKNEDLLKLIGGCKRNRTRVSGNGNDQQTRDYAGQGSQR